MPQKSTAPSADDKKGFGLDTPLAKALLREVRPASEDRGFDARENPVAKRLGLDRGQGREIDPGFDMDQNPLGKRLGQGRERIDPSRTDASDATLAAQVKDWAMRPRNYRGIRIWIGRPWSRGGSIGIARRPTRCSRSARRCPRPNR